MKNIIRNNIKNQRNNLSQENVCFLSDLILNNLLLNKQILNYDNFFVYNSFKNEVDTKKLIKILQDLNKNIYLPVTKNNQMYTVKLTPNTQFELSNFKILQPKGLSQDIDNFVAIVPCVAVDKNGNRIGFGKGYYDKFLKNKTCIKIALCYDFQLVENISPQPHDEKMDIIITQSKIINTKSNTAEKQI